MKYAYDIIKKPIITERSMMGAQDNKYTFEVAIDAGKVEIKKAVEEIFGVLPRLTPSSCRASGSAWAFTLASVPTSRRRS